MNESCNADLPLFDAYPGLRALPYRALGTLPTPVTHLATFGAELGMPGLYLKRDDQSGALYAGNKVRKLEFLLGHALDSDAKSVLTFGAAGSNHALATAIYAEQCGLRCHSMLVPQHNAHSVRRNLLRGHAARSTLHACAGRPGVVVRVAQIFKDELLQHGRFPSVFPPGGSSPLGTIGFVNAAFELKQQIDAGLLPAPDVIYVASGTMGTCVGLLLGLRAAGLATAVHAVAVTKAPYTSAEKPPKLFAAANALLHETDPNFPVFDYPAERFTLRQGFMGRDYALYTEAGCAAVAKIRAAEGVALEGTYTGKALAALMADAPDLAGKTVLFWNSYNGVDVSDVIADVDYRRLPPAFHRYFEDDVQPLDRD